MILCIEFFNDFDVRIGVVVDGGGVVIRRWWCFFFFLREWWWDGCLWTFMNVYEGGVKYDEEDEICFLVLVSLTFWLNIWNDTSTSSVTSHVVTPSSVCHVLIFVIDDDDMDQNQNIYILQCLF